MTTAPPIIWLQAESERNPNVEALDGATWCAEQINEGDICYVRKDVSDAQAAALRTALANFRSQVASIPKGEMTPAAFALITTECDVAARTLKVTP